MLDRDLEDYLKRELGEAYMTAEEISESFHLLDIGVYDEEGDWVEDVRVGPWWTLSEAEEDYR